MSTKAHKIKERNVLVRKINNTVEKNMSLSFLAATHVSLSLSLSVASQVKMWYYLF